MSASNQTYVTYSGLSGHSIPQDRRALGLETQRSSSFSVLRKPSTSFRRDSGSTEPGFFFRCSMSHAWCLDILKKKFVSLIFWSVGRLQSGQTGPPSCPASNPVRKRSQWTQYQAVYSVS